MISKSTTADLLKMYYKLEEFFTQQFKSSKRVFSSLEPRLHERNTSMKRRQHMKKKISGGGGNEAPSLDIGNTDARHHRHWQKPLEIVAGLVVPTLVTRLPRNGNVLGGSVKLHGNNISLACFHGINFKSKSWALFSLKSPFINFTTEAHQDSDTREVFVTQTLTSCLGQNAEGQQQNHSMAIVSRISRNIVFPPQFKTLNEWFHYAFANSEIDAVDRFPILECDREIASNSIERARSASSSTASSTKSQDREVIFALPSLHLHFRTEHKQGPSTPQPSDIKPEVICSFTTEFDDHIFVTVDADAFFFLHDLITSYVKEKEKVIGAQSARAASPNLSQNLKHQLKPYVADEIHKEPQNLQSNSNTSSASNTLSSKNASSTALDINQSQQSMTAQHLTSSNHNINNDTKDSTTNKASNINMNPTSTAATILSHTNSNSATSATAASASSSQNQPSTSQNTATGDSSNDTDLESFFRDWRHFECQTWHLEPTVRILYWAGKSIEPYGIDYILNKLGFSHARTTIPKWLQRGFMDPLDKVQALMMLQLLNMIRENKQESSTKNNKN
uniref:Bridge-like lipid transfer protein family member 1 C-terminal domain-containing protein n=1 Tax=Stomoxys calcitrans TaxID=35570 RepID=A0A1I8PVW9_STOCA